MFSIAGTMVTTTPNLPPLPTKAGQQRDWREPAGSSLALLLSEAARAREGVLVAVMEIDSTIKARSFQKLKEAAAPHKLWIYFGRDIWGFRMFLAANDPERRIIPVLIPHTFVPSFEDIVE